MIRRLFAIVLLASSLAAAEESTWQFDDWSGASIKVRMYVPDDVSADTRIVIVMHGASRDARRYFRDWKTMGIKHNLIVVVPEFTRSKFRGSARYNLGFVFESASGKRRDESTWTFSAIEPLFDAVVARVDGQQSSYALYGHSAGAQFVHRFLYYMPDARVRTFIAANAGWYTVPVNDFAYPYGLLDSGLTDADLPRIFAAPLVLLLGREDVDEADPSLRKTPEAQRQGPNRLARGLTQYRVAKARAEEMGIPFNWQLFVIKGADHVNAKMAPAAAVIAAE